MSRRFQFSLRALLVASVVICVGLGSWRFRSDTRQYVLADHVSVNAPIKVRGQFFHLDGPVIHHFLVLAEAPEKNGKRFRWGESGLARRKGAGTYEVEARLTGADSPGTYKLMLWPMEPEQQCITSTVEVEP